MRATQSKRDPRLDGVQSDNRYCEDCNRQRAFVDGECVVCVARQSRGQRDDGARDRPARSTDVAGVR